MKASELIGCNVLVLADAKICGTVSNLILSDKLNKVLALEVLIDDDDDCEVKYLLTKSIHSTDRDTVTVKYAYLLTATQPCGSRCPINLPTYTEGGKFLGTVTDITMDAWTVRTFTANGEHNISNLLSHSDALLIKKDENSKTKLTQRMRKVPAPKIETAAERPDRRVTVTSIPFPLSRSTNYSFLFGKTATADIFTFDGKLIFPAGTLVTQELVDIAKQSGVIAQLAMYTA